jgi:hypothetical protein
MTCRAKIDVAAAALVALDPSSRLDAFVGAIGLASVDLDLVAGSAIGLRRNAEKRELAEGLSRSTRGNAR